jgi:hypothetical protein
MKSESKKSAFHLECPDISFREKMSMTGFAKYMGYEFQYDPDKRKAILIKQTDQGRKVLFIQKINGRLVGVDREGNFENLHEQMNLSKLLFDFGIFQLPTNPDIGINEYIKDNLKLIYI